MFTRFFPGPSVSHRTTRAIRGDRLEEANAGFDDELNPFRPSSSRVQGFGVDNKRDLDEEDQEAWAEEGGEDKNVDDDQGEGSDADSSEGEDVDNDINEDLDADDGEGRDVEEDEDYGYHWDEENESDDDIVELYGNP